MKVSSSTQANRKELSFLWRTTSIANLSDFNTIWVLNITEN